MKPPWPCGALEWSCELFRRHGHVQRHRAQRSGGGSAKGDPEKLALARRLREATNLTLPQVAYRLHLSTWEKDPETKTHGMLLLLRGVGWGRRRDAPGREFKVPW